jgi:hypothetical protein
MKGPQPLPQEIFTKPLKGRKPCVLLQSKLKVAQIGWPEDFGPAILLRIKHNGDRS